MSDFRLVEAPAFYCREASDPPSVFIAGGIPNVEPWHDRLVELLAATGRPMVVLNPRRRDFPVGDVEEGRRQVAWEHSHLRRAKVTSFWFAAPAEGVDPALAVQPTTLLELGVALGEGRRVVVGADVRYPRLDILRNQLAHYPDVAPLRFHLPALVADVVFELLAPTHLDGEQT